MSLVERPAGITCEDWEPTVQGGRRCRYYNDNGSCRLPKYLMCVEWLKVNPSPLAIDKPLPTALEALRTPTPPAKAPEPIVDGALVLRSPEPKPGLARGGAASRARQAYEKPNGVSIPQTEAPASPDDPVDRLVASLEGFADEVQVESPTFGAVSLVKERGRHPEQPTRLEITYREAASLAEVVRVFPGAQLLSFTPPKDKP